MKNKPSKGTKEHDITTINYELKDGKMVKTITYEPLGGKNE